METLPPLPARVLPDFLAQLRQLLPTTLAGLYLTGSVPLGDYHAGKSDVDFLVLLHAPLDAAQLARCGTLHQNLEEKYHANLSGYYLTLVGLAERQPHFPSFFEGRMQPQRPFELPTVSLFEWQTIGLTLFGKPARELLPAPSVAAVVAELHQNLNDYWKRWIARHTFPRPGYWLLVLFPRLTEWGVLGVARQLYTLDTGRITSKQAAGQHCLPQLPVARQPLLRTALAIRQVNQTQLRPSVARARQTLACMDWLLAEFNRRYAVAEAVAAQ